MLSEFEQKLYAIAAEQGYQSMDPSNDFLCRHAIEQFLIDVTWKTIRANEAPDFLKPLLDDIEPQQMVFSRLKGKLPLEHYNLGDYEVTALQPLLNTHNLEGLQQALSHNPKLINRRNLQLRTLLHEAICLREAEPLITLLLNNGASVAIPTAAGINAATLAIQLNQFKYFELLKPALYQQVSQYDQISSLIKFTRVCEPMIIGEAIDKTQRAVLELHNDSANFKQPNSTDEKSRLLHQSIAERFDLLTRALILDGAPVNEDHLSQFISMREEKVNDFIPYQGIPSLMLAAGVSTKAIPAIIEQLTQKIAARESRYDSDYDRSLIRYNLFMYHELMLFNPSETMSAVIYLKLNDYEKLKARNLLTTNNVIYIVEHPDSKLIMHYQKFGFDQQIDITLRIDAKRLTNNPNEVIPRSKRSREQLDGAFLSKAMKKTEESANVYKRHFTHLQASTPFDLSRLIQSEMAMIETLKSMYGEMPIPLYEEGIQKVAYEASRHHLNDLQTYLYDHLHLSHERKNLKPLLYRSTFFLSHFLRRYIITQACTDQSTFYQIILLSGIPLNEGRPYAHDSIERQAMGAVTLTKNKRMPVNGHGPENPINHSTIIYEIDILKGIKPYYLYMISKSMKDPSWALTRTAIRDTLVLGLSTLFLNVIRTNRDLSTLKDTKSYLKLCELMKTVPISDEAKQTLMQRVRANDNKPTPRDVAMALALACDFDSDKATFIQLCRDHLLTENPSIAERSALNAALRLLSVDEHETLRARLIAVSNDPSLLPSLKARLAEKNCLFIEIIRTSAERREVKNTTSFTKWAEAMDSTPSKSFKFIPPRTLFDPKVHSANIDSTNPNDDEAGLGFPQDRPRR